MIEIPDEMLERSQDFAHMINVEATRRNLSHVEVFLALITIKRAVRITEGPDADRLWTDISDVVNGVTSDIDRKMRMT